MKTLRGITAFVAQAMTSEETSRAQGLLQALDPRAKLFAGMALIIFISLTGNIITLLVVLVALSILAVVSRVTPRVYLARVWVPSLFFGGAVALPAAVNIFVPGNPLVTLWTISGRDIAITSQGLLSALTLVLRIAASISVVTLVLLTTRWNEIMRALRLLGLPQAPVFTLAISFRYIHLFVSVLESMHQAKMSRTLRDQDTPGGQKAAASAAGSLLKKYLEMSEQVYSAMVSRGFSDF